MNEQLNFWIATTKKCKCDNKSEFYYKGIEYCQSCLIKKLKIKVVDYIKYYKDGIFLGCSNFDIIKVFKKVDINVNRIKIY